MQRTDQWQSSAHFSHHGKYRMCRKHTLPTGLNLSVRLISMSSIVLRSYSNTIKIEHLQDYVYRSRVKWRVEVIVQIIQAKTKWNKMKPTPAEKKKAALGVWTILPASLHCLNSPALRLYLLFLRRWSLSYVEEVFPPNIISSTTSKNAFVWIYPSLPYFPVKEISQEIYMCFYIRQQYKE